MQLSKSHLRAAALIAGGAAVGALGTAGTLGPVGAPTPSMSAVEAAEPTAGGAVLPLQTSPSNNNPSATHATAVRRESPAFGGSIQSIDPRYLAAPLSERFAQATPGASNPGERGAPHRDPLSNMIAAIFPSNEDTRTIVLSPRVNPPPDDESGENPPEEPCEGDCDTPIDPPGGGGDETPSGVPEIDANLLGAGLLLLIGGALVLSSRRSL